MAEYGLMHWQSAVTVVLWTSLRLIVNSDKILFEQNCQYLCLLTFLPNQQLPQFWQINNIHPFCWEMLVTNVSLKLSQRRVLPYKYHNQLNKKIPQE